MHVSMATGANVMPLFVPEVQTVVVAVSAKRFQAHASLATNAAQMLQLFAVIVQTRVHTEPLLSLLQCLNLCHLQRLTLPTSPSHRETFSCTSGHDRCCSSVFEGCARTMQAMTLTKPLF
jgi:hypothetical protein